MNLQDVPDDIRRVLHQPVKKRRRRQIDGALIIAPGNTQRQTIGQLHHQFLIAERLQRRLDRRQGVLQLIRRDHAVDLVAGDIEFTVQLFSKPPIESQPNRLIEPRLYPHHLLVGTASHQRLTRSLFDAR